MIRFATALAAAIGLSHAIAHAAAIDELTPAQKADVMNGKQVLIEVPRSGAPWPEIWTYQLMDTTPEEAMAVAADYEYRKTYMPDLTLAKISNVIDARTVEVSYRIELPVIGHENFTLWHQVSSYDGGMSYRIDYHLVRADRTKQSTGYSRFEPLGTGTLVAGMAFVDPGNPLAVIIKRQAVQKTLTAIQKYVETVLAEKTGNPALLEEQLSRLRAALGS